MQCRYVGAKRILLGLLVVHLHSCVSGAVAEEHVGDQGALVPLQTAAIALQHGNITYAHLILEQMSRRGGATTLSEMQPAGGHGQALRVLFDELGDYAVLRCVCI